MNRTARLPLDLEIAALKAEIRRTARELRDVSRSLRRPAQTPVAVPVPVRLRFLRGGLWKPPR